MNFSFLLAHHILHGKFSLDCEAVSSTSKADYLSGSRACGVFNDAIAAAD